MVGRVWFAGLLLMSVSGCLQASSPEDVQAVPPEPAGADIGPMEKLSLAPAAGTSGEGGESIRLYKCDIAEMWVLAAPAAVAERLPEHLMPTLTVRDPVTEEPLGHVAQVLAGTCQGGAFHGEHIKDFGFVRSSIFVGPVAGPRGFNGSLLLEWQVDSAPLAQWLSPWTEHMVLGEFSLYDALSGRPVAFTVAGEPWSAVTMADVVPAHPAPAVAPVGTLHLAADGNVTPCTTATTQQSEFAAAELRGFEFLADDAGAMLGHQGFWQQSGPAPAVHPFGQTMHWDAATIFCPMP